MGTLPRKGTSLVAEATLEVMTGLRPREHKEDKNNHNPAGFDQFPGKIISSENGRQPGHGGQGVIADFAGLSCTNPLIAFAVNDHAILNLSSRRGVGTKDCNLRAIDFIHT